MLDRREGEIGGRGKGSLLVRDVFLVSLHCLVFILCFIFVLCIVFVFVFVRKRQPVRD